MATFLFICTFSVYMVTSFQYSFEILFSEVEKGKAKDGTRCDNIIIAARRRTKHQNENSKLLTRNV